LWADGTERCPADGTVLAFADSPSEPSELSAGGTIGTGKVAVAMPAEAISDDLAPGTRVGEYEIERVLGWGGMGTVYGARHPLIGKRTAIKVLHAAMSVDREAIARFVQEAQAVNRIGHANIVDIFSFGTLPDGRAYFVMEWLQGETLEARIARAVLPITDAATILLALVRALEAAHAASVIHRDLKPENVFLVADDEGFRVKLLDFGIAKLSSTERSASRTATGVTVGTPLFMSPEQARGTDIDARTDLYSLGVVGYAMVCGKTPFEGEASTVEVMHAHLVKPPRPPRELRPELPEAFEAMLLGLLAKAAADRPPLAEVRRTLAGIATRTPAAGLSVATVQALGIAIEDDDEVPRRRTGVFVAIAVALAVVAGAGAIALSQRGSEPDSSERPAVAQAQTPTPTPPPAPAPAPAPAVPAPPAQPAGAPTPPAPPPPTPEPAVVDLAVEPALAVVALDGKPVVVDHGHVHLEVDPGSHAVTARAAGYRPVEQTVDAEAGKSAALTLRLTRVPTAAPTPATPAKVDRDNVVDPFHRKP
jgi:serine/threonine-protein kinase